MLKHLAFVASFSILSGVAMAQEEEVYPDFAKIEAREPLSAALRQSLTPAQLQTWTQEQLDRLYAKLTAGPIPDGPHDGTVIFAPGEQLDKMAGFASKLGIPLTPQQLKKFAELMWAGKHFFKDQGILRNRMTGLGLKFPAKLYCGQSLLDSRRESVIIDYAFTHQIEGYDSKIDWLAGSEGLKVRDEVRMIRPGFYLGRAYMDRVFLLNFTLYKEGAEVADEECWKGTQKTASTN
jgi:hypothetical protein